MEEEKTVDKRFVDQLEKSYHQYLFGCMGKNSETLTEMPPKTDTFPDEAMETLINIFENIFETACVATLLLDSNEITVEDSRYLFTSVVQIAFEFEKQFDPGYGDYILKIKDYAERRLLSEFRPED